MSNRSQPRSIALGMLLAALGCGGSEGDALELGTPAPGSPSPADDEVPTDGSRASVNDEDQENEDPDDDEPDDAGPGFPTELCSGIDLVFVVNNQHTMFDEQLKLQAAATAFVDVLSGTIPEVSENLHVGVLTTDDHRFVSTTSACDAPYASGTSYMVFGETMGDELGCALEVGIDGDPNDRPAHMLLDALSDEMRAPGAFHGSFLREKALLVVVIATNQDDRPDPVTGWGSDGDPVDWAAALADLKGGYPENVVVLSLVGTPKPNACPDDQWNGHEGAELATRLIELTEAFPHGAVGDLCRPEYAGFLLGEIPGIVEACSELVVF